LTRSLIVVTVKPVSLGRWSFIGVRLDLTILLPYVGFLGRGALLTVQACALSLVGAVLLGVIVAIARTASSPLARRLAEAYVDIFRNIPFIVQLFFLYYGLPEIGNYIDAFTTGVIALSIAGGAYASDAIRAGILAIDNGILEAAEVSGLSRRVVFTRIVLPIALSTSVRPLGSVLINMILTSSILSTITVNELTGQAKIVASDTFRPFEVYAALLIVYATLTWLLSLGIGALHRRLNRAMPGEFA
jgi:polar amino acid transport system permease protein/putative glutamine transport system permease protein